MNFANVTEWKIPVNGTTRDVLRVTHNNIVLWEKQTGPDYTEPFYAENITNENETLSILKDNNGAPTLTIEYSTDKTVWRTLGTTSTTAITITLQPNAKVYLRCNTNTWYSDGVFAGNHIGGVSKVGGNIMSLLYGSNFTGQETSFPSGSTCNFNMLFAVNGLMLIDASKLLLPATTLTSACYQQMFSYCESLTQAPVLPATTLAEYCYSYMLEGCSLLSQAPALPATTLVEGCYYNMFYGCTALTNVKCLATNRSAQDCTNNWLNGVSSTGTFTKAAGVNWPTGVSGIPSGWTVVEQ